MVTITMARGRCTDRPPRRLGCDRNHPIGWERHSAVGVVSAVPGVAVIAARTWQ